MIINDSELITILNNIPKYFQIVGINEGDSEMVSRREVIAKESIRRHAKMCIDHKNGIALWSSNICFPGPGHINEHRKHKRRCLGIHPYRIDFSKRYFSTSLIIIANLKEF